MASTNEARVTKEKSGAAYSGWVALGVAVLAVAGGLVSFGTGVSTADRGGPPELFGTQLLLAVLLGLVALLSLAGLFTLQPNEARVLILFGSYKGTVRRSGFHFANPFYARSRGKKPLVPTKISLRARNFESSTLKVNDKRGNPVEIAAVIVWRVSDTARAVFDVEAFETYVAIQAESAIRSIASHYAYDHGEGDEITLRGGGDEVAAKLTRELHERLEIAGVEVEESRLTHLAYAPEIASAMLRRQQAEAVISARHKIVQGAVSMVEMALSELEAKAVVKLDEERRAAMVSNLLVVLCGTSEAAPVINTGTLYS